MRFLVRIIDCVRPGKGRVMFKRAMLACALASICSTYFAGPMQAGESASYGTQARIRFVAAVAQAARVSRIGGLSCEVRNPRPWLKLQCGVLSCPKPKFLGIPLLPSYTGLDRSPWLTEVLVDAGKPLAFNFTASFAHAERLSYPLTTVYVQSCDLDAVFTPLAGHMYEASLQAEGAICQLRLSEIKTLDANPVRFPIENAQTKSNDCSGGRP